MRKERPAIPIFAQTEQRPVPRGPSARQLNEYEHDITIHKFFLDLKSKEESNHTEIRPVNFKKALKSQNKAWMSPLFLEAGKHFPATHISNCTYMNGVLS